MPQNRDRSGRQTASTFQKNELRYTTVEAFIWTMHNVYGTLWFQFSLFGNDIAIINTIDEKCYE